MLFRKLLKKVLLLAVLLIGTDAAATVPVSGNYYVKNLGLGTYVKVTGKYSAEPDATCKADASSIRIGVTDGVLADGTYQMNSLASTYGTEETPVECYDYVARAIAIGTSMLKQELQQKGVSDANVLKSIQVMTDFINSYAYMRLKPVEGKADTYLSVNTIPSMQNDSTGNGQQALAVMYKLGVITAPTDAAAWVYLKSLVNEYLSTSNTDSALKEKVLNNIDKVNIGKTYLLGADSYNTFDYTEYTDEAAANPLFQWKLVPYTSSTETASGIYKIHNVGQDKYVKVLRKYYAMPNYSEDEASDIHITANGATTALVSGTENGGTKITSLGATAADGTEVEVSDYVSKAISIGGAMVKTLLDKSGLSAAKKLQAQKYLDEFVSANAYMVVEPIEGTDYVWAYATLPVLPDSVKAVIVKYGQDMGSYTKPASNDEVWQYLINLVHYYLDNNSQTSSDLRTLVLNNIDNAKEGVTYYLKADADGTFGYVAVEAGQSLTDAQKQDKDLWWGIDIESIDTKAESGFYKIHNIGLDKYVKVEQKYYARPNVDLADATPIHVGLNAQKNDGSYDLNSLAGSTPEGLYVECYDYVDKAINIGKVAVEKILADSNTSQENIDKADENLEEFVRDNAYMTIRPVPGKNNAFYAYATVPSLPDDVQAAILKKAVSFGDAGSDNYVAAPTTTDEIWPYLKGIVKYYLSKSQTDSKLKSMVLNNIDKIELGHTYYLNGDTDYTFGLVDATEADFTDEHLQWGFDSSVTPEPFAGYYRIRNAAGNTYVNVTGHFTADPSTSKTDAQTAAGSIIYVKAEDTKDGVSMPLSTLRSQGVEVADYLDGIQTCLNAVSSAAVTVMTEYLQNSTNYSKYAVLVEPAIDEVVSSIDLHLYVEPTFTSAGEDAYFLKATVPDVNDWLTTANEGLQLMGKDKQWLHDKVADKLGDFDTSTGKGKLKQAVLDLILVMDDTDAFWSLLKQKGLNMLNNSSYFEKLSAMLPEEALEILKNNLADVNYGTTYCLIKDSYGTMGFDSRTDCTDNDSAKWVLEPFSADAEGYDAYAYNKLGIVPEVSYVTMSRPNADSNYLPEEQDSYWFTTGIYDFDAQVEAVDGEKAKAYIATATRDTTVTEPDGNGNKVQRVYWLVTLKEVTGTIPAHTPVLWRTQVQSDVEPSIAVSPVGTPTTEAVESDDVISSSDFYLTMSDEETVKQLFYQLLGGTSTTSAPRKVVVNGDDGNILVGSLLAMDNDNADLMPLMTSSLIEEANTAMPTLNMSGLGFWKVTELPELEANKAYLNALGQNGYNASVTNFTGWGGKYAPGYILNFIDGTAWDNWVMTSVTDLQAAKTVQSVTYYNVAGQQAEQPFDGVNIVVTRFTDGTQAVDKIVK